MSVYKKLNDARDAFHQLKLTKTGLNKFAGYQYFELADFLIPAMRVLREQGLCAYVSFGKELATMKIVDMDDGTFIEITSPMSSAALKGCHEVQNLGAVQTYLRRYLWVAALEIVEHDAVDSSSGKEPEKKVPVVTATAGIGDELPEDQKQYLADLATQCIDLVREGAPRRAYELIKSNKLDDHQETWLSRQMDSKVRNAIKASKAVPL